MEYFSLMFLSFVLSSITKKKCVNAWLHWLPPLTTPGGRNQESIKRRLQCCFRGPVLPPFPIMKSRRFHAWENTGTDAFFAMDRSCTCVEWTPQENRTRFSAVCRYSHEGPGTQPCHLLAPSRWTKTHTVWWPTTPRVPGKKGERMTEKFAFWRA